VRSILLASGRSIGSTDGSALICLSVDYELDKSSVQRSRSADQGEVKSAAEKNRLRNRGFGAGNNSQNEGGHEPHGK
jgi:hypothetical protein